MDLKLRDYQQQAVDALWRKLCSSRSALLVLPTGAGKTECLVGFIQKCLKIVPKFKCVFLVNKIKLAEQSEGRIIKYLGPDVVDVYCGSLKRKELLMPVTVASIQSIKDVSTRCNLVIFDETHRVNYNSGQFKQFMDLCLKNNPLLKIIGVSATPYREDGYIYGDGKLFDEVCFERGLKWAIENGFLVPPRIKHTDEQFDVSKLRVQCGEWRSSDVAKLTADLTKLKIQVSDALSKLIGRKKIIWACSSIKHAEDVCLELLERNEEAVIVHSKQSKEENDWNLNKFQEENGRHLVFVTIVSEGFDYPPIDAVVLMRPTRSPVLAFQTIGRGLRTYPGKIDCLVLDYGRVIEFCGPIDNPNIPKGKNKKDVIRTAMKFCKNCYEYVDAKETRCPACGWKFQQEERDTTKNLTLFAAANEVLSPSLLPIKMFVKRAVIEDCVSKAGRPCKKITYYTENLINPKVSEWFVLDGPEWVIDKFEKRSSTIKLSDYGKLYIVTEWENGYLKVKRIGRDFNSNVNLRLFE